MTGRKKTGLSPGERRRVQQLIVCLVLFGVVFLGRGVDLGPVSRISQSVGDLVRADTDFQVVFAQLGETVSKGEPVAETAKDLLPQPLRRAGTGLYTFWQSLTAGQGDRTVSPAPQGGDHAKTS